MVGNARARAHSRRERAFYSGCDDSTSSAPTRAAMLQTHVVRGVHEVAVVGQQARRLGGVAVEGGVVQRRVARLCMRAAASFSTTTNR